MSRTAMEQLINEAADRKMGNLDAYIQQADARRIADAAARRAQMEADDKIASALREALRGSYCPPLLTADQCRRLLQLVGGV